MSRGSPTPQPVFVRDADVVDAQRIETHQLGCHGIHRYLIRGRQHDVLDHRKHRARSRSVTGGRAVHHGEDPTVDLALDRQQIHQRLMDPGVGVVPVVVEQPAECVLHRPGGGGVDVALGGR